MTCQSIQAAISETVYGGLQSPDFGEGVRAHLGDCLGCRRHAHEMSGVAALMGNLPRVTAPADFDFKLRARIARAKADERAQGSWFAAFFGRSFSWAQASGAMAAVALVVGITTYQLLPGAAVSVAPTTEVAVNANHRAADTTPLAPQVESVAAGSRQSTEAAISAQPASVKTTRIRGGLAPAVATRASYTPASEPRAVETANLVAARNTILIKNAHGQASRMVALPEVQEVTYGAPSVSLRPARSGGGEITTAAIF
jgi:hypothetical protein